MKDFIIILLLLGVLWGGYKGMTYLGSLAQTEGTESDPQEEAIEDNSEKRLNQSAIKEMKKVNPEVEKKKVPTVKSPEVTEPPVEKTNGQKAMEAVRGTRLDAEGNLRSKEDFYKESNQEETTPYERNESATVHGSTQNKKADTDLKEQEVALVEKGKALAGEFKDQRGEPKKKKTTTRTPFNIEKGESEPATSPALPREYNQPAGNFIPSKYILVAGSYASADNAVKEVLRLKKLGYPKASIVLSEKNLNLISLGSFSDKATANAEAAQIKKTGIDLYVKGIR